MRTMPVVLLLAFALTACGSDTGENTEVPQNCNGSEECDPGFDCVEGLCSSASGDGDAGELDAGDDDAATDSGGEEDTTLTDTTDEDATGQEDAGEDDVSERDTSDDDAIADAGEDTTEEDVGADVAEDATEDTADVEDIRYTIAIIEPRLGASTAIGEPMNFVIQTDNPDYSPEELWVEVESSLEGFFFEGAPEEDGRVVVDFTPTLEGTHIVTARVTAPDDETRTDEIAIAVCAWGETITFDGDISEDWVAYGDAFQAPGGWLDMTGNAQGRKGAYFNVGDLIADGDVTLRFRISTGQCGTPDTDCTVSSPGADGFALSVVNAADLDELEMFIDNAASGGGLGYGVGGAWGDMEIEAFHIEFDTWFNRFNGSNEFHTDPTENNHIEITFNGDASPLDPPIFAEVEAIEDNYWHDVTVRIEGSSVEVIYDGATVIDQVVDSLSFKGGYIGFTGTTGFYTNHHRFDDLEVLQECRVED